MKPATGGDGLSVCSRELLLEALVACAGITLCAAATVIGFEICTGIVKAEGDLDFLGTLGVSKEALVGVQKIQLQVELDTDASAKQLATLIWLTEPYYVVYQTLRQSAKIDGAFS